MAAKKVRFIDTKEQQVITIVGTPILPVFQKLHEISDAIWNDEPNNDVTPTWKLIELAIESKQVSIQYVLRTIDYVITKRPKFISRLSNICIQIFTKYGERDEIRNNDIRVMLHSRGFFKDEKFNKKVSEVFSIYKENTVQYFICWDRVDDLKKSLSSPKVEVDSSAESMTLLDLAAKFGSVQCFKYLIEINNKPTKFTNSYAIEGGNTEIIKFLAENQNVRFENCIPDAISSNRNELADWIKSRCTVANINLAQCLKASNYVAASYCMIKGYEVNEKFDEECPLSIAIKNNTLEVVKYFVEKGAYVNTMLYCIIQFFIYDVL